MNSSKSRRSRSACARKSSRPTNAARRTRWSRSKSRGSKNRGCPTLGDNESGRDCILATRSCGMSTPDNKPLKMFLVPCSCGTTFTVAENYDRQGTAWSRYLKCPNCEKRHDPKNRLLQLGYQSGGYWKVDKC